MSTDNANAELQADELTALASIYGDEMSEFDQLSNSFSISIRGSSFHTGSADQSQTVTINVTFPPLYPTECPPVFELNAPWLRGELRRLLEDRLVEICQDFTGCAVVYAWAEAIKQFIDENAYLCASSETKAAEVKYDEADFRPDKAITTANKFLDDFVHGEPIEDRRSVFQAHLLSPVLSPTAARQALTELISKERKIASATHNIWAYRIARQSEGLAGSNASPVSFLTDCDDDGEHQAGGRLLRLLELSDYRNVLVVVSRWFGGTLLGADRFKHINNAARRLLEQQGIIRDSSVAAKRK